MNFTLTDGTRVHLIGDPHMGKRFDVGVPSHRRGERETKQATKFQQELDADADLIIIVGDLFDHPYVPYAVVDSVAKALRSAAERNPDTDYVVMAGNHDVPRNLTAVGAFHDLEERLADRAENLILTRRPLAHRGVAVFPWEWQRTAASQVADLHRAAVEAVVGHWDMVAHEGKDDHLAPVEELRKAFGDVPLYSGHYHKAGDYTVAGATVHGTGSMEPYSHGEDPDGALYVTLRREEALADPEALKHKNVRLRLAPGEDVPVLDALSVTVLRETKRTEASTDTMSLEDFDWNTILSKRMKKLDPFVQGFIKERLPYDVK